MKDVMKITDKHIALLFSILSFQNKDNKVYSVSTKQKLILDRADDFLKWLKQDD